MPTSELQELKRRVGRQPFESRLQLNNDFCACPFHNGDSLKSMHLYIGNDGTWQAHCFSNCKQSWDAVAFVQKKDSIDFAEALRRLEELPPDARTAKPKRKPLPMTTEQWAEWGRAIEQADLDTFAASRPHSHTAGLEFFRALDVRVKDDYLGFPYRRNGDFTGVKMRKIAAKGFIFANAVDTTSLFNLDAVNPLEDAYTVEGEPDVLTMAEYGLVAVSPFSSQQQKFSPEAVKALSCAPRIFVVGDQDTPGQEFADRLQKLLPSERTFRIKFSEANDVGELALKLGSEFPAHIQRLTDEAVIPRIPWVIQNIQQIHAIPKDKLLWVVDRMFLFKGLNLLSGRQGAMKTFLAMLAAQKISGGALEFLGRKILCLVKIGDGSFVNRPMPKVLYIDRENPAAMVEERRTTLGIVGNRDFFYWGDWADEPIPDDPLDPRIVEFAKQGYFIIFDSLQQWLCGTNENATAEMLVLMNKFKHLARIGAGALLLHHDNKPDRKTGLSQTRGSTVIVAATDMAIKVAKRDDGVLELRRDRFRVCPDWEMDIQPHFGAEYHSFEVLLDEDAAASARRRKQAADEKTDEERGKKFEEETDDRNRLSSEVTKNPKLTARTLEEKTNISRKRVVRLLEEAKWTWQDGRWVHDEIGTPENDLPF